MTRGGFKLRAVLALCLPVRCHRVLALILRCTNSELLCCAVLRCAALCLCCACAVLCCAVTVLALSQGAVTGCCHRVLALYQLRVAGLHCACSVLTLRWLGVASLRRCDSLKLCIVLALSRCLRCACAQAVTGCLRCACAVLALILCCTNSELLGCTVLRRAALCCAVLALCLRNSCKLLAL